MSPFASIAFQMAWLARRVTGLSWPRFFVAHLPAAGLAVVMAAAAAVVAHWARAAHLGGIFVLAMSGLAAAAVVIAVSRLRPSVFLGPHGNWAVAHAANLLRRGPGRRGGGRRAAGAELASAGEANPD